jgi:hypothetical protein
MRKTIVAITVAGLMAGLVALPAHARGKKKVNESFTAQAAPFPNLSSATGTPVRSCFAGVEDVHWVSVEFTAPGKGTLTASMEGFVGDWDLAIVLDGIYFYSVEDQTAGAPAEEEVVVPLKPKQTVAVAACNFAGAPEAEVTYGGTFK